MEQWVESCVVLGGAGIPSGNSQKLGTLLHTFPKNVGFYELSHNCLTHNQVEGVFVLFELLWTPGCSAVVE